MEAVFGLAVQPNNEQPFEFCYQCWHSRMLQY